MEAAAAAAAKAIFNGSEAHALLPRSPLGLKFPTEASITFRGSRSSQRIPPNCHHLLLSVPSPAGEIFWPSGILNTGFKDAHKSQTTRAQEITARQGGDASSALLATFIRVRALCFPGTGVHNDERVRHLITVLFRREDLRVLFTVIVGFSPV